MISAFGVEHGCELAKGVRTDRFKQGFDQGRRDSHGARFYGHGPKEAIGRAWQPKTKNMRRAFKQIDAGEYRAWRAGTVVGARMPYSERADARRLARQVAKARFSGPEPAATGKQIVAGLKRIKRPQVPPTRGTYHRDAMTRVIATRKDRL